MIRFSVITIVRNDVVGVIRTLKSVFEQTYENFELIVQDGASTDGTSEILLGFEDRIDDLTIEQDDGIYDAMNRALKKATGEYCIFMNAADFFFDNKVLERVAKLIDPKTDDIWAGQAIGDERGTVHKYRPPEQFWAGSTFDHQASFIRTSLMKELAYDTRYKISGDLHFFTRARKRGAQIKYDQTIIARKPFAVGASSGFTDRVRDRLVMLEKAWGDVYPVRKLIEREMRAHMAKSHDIDPDLLGAMMLDDLLDTDDGWRQRL